MNNTVNSKIGGIGNFFEREEGRLKFFLKKNKREGTLISDPRVLRLHVTSCVYNM